MQLYYFKDPNGNFGDDLNPWIWSRLAPKLFDNDDSEVLVGIGTLLNHRLPVKPVKHVFGSGVGYGSVPKIDDRFRIHAVRGFLSASTLQIQQDKVITDPAVLLRIIDIEKVHRQVGRVGVIFTGQSLAEYNWQGICERVGLHFISCHWSVDRVLAEILSCEKILAEAMHGAIAADTLRVPWIPITCNPDILGFKWRDWLSTMNIEYKPSDIQRLQFKAQSDAAQVKMKVLTKRGMSALGILPKHWTPLPPPPSTPYDIDRAARQLMEAANLAGDLSQEHLVDTHAHRFKDLIDRFIISRERG